MDQKRKSRKGYDPDGIPTLEEMELSGKHTTKKETETEENTDNAEKHVSAFINFFKSKITHGYFGIVIMLMAAFILIFSISYFFTADADQSQVLNLPLSEMANQQNIDNEAGPVGAVAAHYLIGKGLGVGSLVLVFYMVLIGLALMGRYKMNFWSCTFKSIIVAIAASVTVGLFSLYSECTFYLGGEHGHYVNTFLIKYAGPWGALGVSILLVASVIAIFFFEIRAVLLKYKAAIDARKERLRREAEEKNIATANTAVTEEPEEEGNEEIIVDFDVTTDDTTDDETYTEQDIVEPEFQEVAQEPIIEAEEGTTDNDSMQITATEIEEAASINTDAYDPTAELSKFRFPSIELLSDQDTSAPSVDNIEQENNKQRIKDVLKQYDIEVSNISATVGPTVTLYEIVPAEGVRIAKIKRLEDDIALNLAALGIRIIAPIPGKGTIGIEVPNKEPKIVPMRSIISSKTYQESKAELPIAIGVTISNEVYLADLAKIPHLLVAGATGMGKSVGLNAIIASLLYKKHPAELKFVLIDPKMVEFSLYRRLERHYLAKLPDEEDAVITDPNKVVATLLSLCVEMDNRYALLTKANVRSITEYNAKFSRRVLNPEKGHRYLPYIVVIVDEFADLIMTAGKEIETPISRIAQKARAVGIHLILATQRPSTNVVTGLIKANFPGRIGFRVNQMVDSRTIIDRPGADQLIGKGDMLFSRDGVIERVQCAFISTEEVVAICNSIDEQIGYSHAYMLPDYIPEGNSEGLSTTKLTDRDPLFDEIARVIVNSQSASTSSIQRTYSIGYNRAGRIMDQMEAVGIVGPAQGGKPRQVLVDSIQLEQILNNK